MDRDQTDTRNPSPSGPLTEPVLAALAEAFRGIRFGIVTIVVHDGQVVQIDRTERRRLQGEAKS